VLGYAVAAACKTGDHTSYAAVYLYLYDTGCDNDKDSYCFLGMLYGVVTIESRGLEGAHFRQPDLYLDKGLFYKSESEPQVSCSDKR
jgi:hypothetical protein